MLNDIQKSILQTVSDMVSIPDGAVNIRLDGQKEFRQNSEHIQIVSKTDKDGIDIRIAPFTKSENVHIPVILSKSGFHDLVYNDFFVGEGADVTIVAGCGIHNCGDCDSEHDGIHTFYIGKNAKVHYIEKHYGEGEGSGKRILNPQTIVYLEEGASIVMDTSQIGGVDDTKRYTKCEANGANSEVQINEKLLTAGDQHAVSEMDVILNGEGSRTRVVSRSVAKEASTQIFYPRVQGNALCFGHVSCDSIIMGAAKVRSIPEISCNHVDAALMHEAAIGKIAGEQLLKLETLSLSSTVNNGVASYPITSSADNTDDNLQVNSYVNYQIQASQNDNCLMVPIQAVRTVGLEDGSSATVVYVQADSRPDNALELPYQDEEIPSGFYPVQVEIGIQDTYNVEIKSGVNDGDTVFTQMITDQAWG